MFHELFDGQQRLPFHLFLIDAETYNSHFHSELEICFVLNGEAEFHVDEKVFPLYHHDFLITRPLVLHRINRCTADCRMLMLHINLNAFQKYDPDGLLQRFEFAGSMNSRSNPLYQTLYESYRKMLQIGIEGRTSWKLQMLKEVTAIVIALTENTPSGKSSFTPLSMKDAERERIRTALTWLDEHWQESFTMEELAAHMHLSPSGFSRFFKNAMHTGFQQYVTDLRLNRSLHLLSGTDQPVLDIALACGFNDYKTYGRLFRKSFGISPSQYRKTAERHEPLLPMEKTISSEHILSTIPASFTDERTRDLQVIELEPLVIPAKPVAMHYGAILDTGPLSSFSLSRIQEQILFARKQLDTRFISFEVSLNEFRTSHVLHSEETFQAFAFLSAHHLNPVIRFSPLTAQDDPVGDLNRFLSSLHELLDTLSVPVPLIFRMWDLPELEDHPYYRAEDLFFLLVQRVCQTIRTRFPGAKLIAPAAVGRHCFDLFRRFVSFAKEQKLCYEDWVFLSCDVSDPLNQSIPKGLKPHAEEIRAEKKAEDLRSSLLRMSGILNSAGLTPHIIVSRWPMSACLQDYTRDTASLPARMLKEMTPALSVCRGILAQLSDSQDERSRREDSEFHGGSGLLTRHGIPKPAFSLLRFIRHLGEECIETGSHYIVTRTGTTIQLLLYHDCPFSEEYLSRSQSLLSEENRYSIYSPLPEIQFSLRLNVPQGNYLVETSLLSREYGSSYDAWTELGCPRSSFLQYTDYLHSRCYPEMHTEQKTVHDLLHLDMILKPHSVMLITIRTA